MGLAFGLQTCLIMEMARVSSRPSIFDMESIMFGLF